MQAGQYKLKRYSVLTKTDHLLFAFSLIVEVKSRVFPAKKEDVTETKNGNFDSSYYENEVSTLLDTNEIQKR